MIHPTENHDAAGADDSFIKAYRSRIGFSGELRTDLATLTSILTRHIDAIPFEALDVITGQGIDLTPDAIADKLLRRRRGGYCFEQNQLLHRALLDLGFDVETLIARVVWQLPTDHPMPGWTHMALRVTVDGVPYLVDAGFGSNVPTAPIRLDETAPQETAFGRFRIVSRMEGFLLETQTGDDWLPVYLISPQIAVQADFELGNWFTATHPASEFRSRLILARTTRDRQFTLADNRLTIRHANAEKENQALDAAGVESALSEIFLLPFDPAWKPHMERIVRSAADRDQADENE